MCCQIAAGIVYRNLAARNCLVDKHGRVKIDDFDLSRCLQNDTKKYYSRITKRLVRWHAVEVKRLTQPQKCSGDIYELMVDYMPYLFISTRTRLESGPTIVGDEQTDPEIMAHLGAQLFHEKCNNFSEYRTDDCARIVLDKLEQLGYHVISMTGIGQTCIWLLHKD
ncbi:unnamed protein product [Rotaria sordida]|uniref:GTP cyclohydrolase 1 feedback regulatory protein n=1 Tax=Rotaria sordida TaxID=392033 RepID=A0A818Q3D0_9BILA|nr:unnamed protein product [Rotaria sordida]